MKNYKIVSIIIAISMMITMLFQDMQVEASTASAVDVTASKIYDLALTKTGVVADKSVIDSVIDQTINAIEGTAQSYKQWCEDNGKVRNAETWQEYLESDAYSTLAWRLSSWVLRSADIINYIITGESLTDELRQMIPTALTGLPAADIAKGFTLPSDVVEDIRNEFDKYIIDYGDYYYIKTFSPTDMNPLWFTSVDNYNATVEYLKTIPNICYMTITSYGSYGYFSMDSENTMIANKFHYYVYPDTVYLYSDSNDTAYEYSITRVYDENWEYPAMCYWDTGSSGRIYYDTYEHMLETFEGYHEKANVYLRLKKYGSNDNPTVPIGIYTSDGRLVKVYRNENALKLNTLGKDSYYVTDNSMDYTKNTDNSVTVTGDYLVDNSNTYSHDIIQETINNTENVTQETVNNIVNEGATTIINNYGSTSSGGGGNGGSDSGNNSILDGLGSIISALSDIVGFLLGVIGDVISLIGSLFTTVFEGLKSFVSIFSGFTGLLGEIFTFLPKELLDFLVLSIEAVIGIAIWKKFSK